MPVQPELPAILTKKDWDKNKGTIATMAGKTGIGEAMTEVKAAYDAITWTKFDAMLALPGVKLVEKVTEGLDAAKSEYKKVEALRKKVSALGTLARTTEAKFKKSKTIPASSGKYVGSVAARADSWTVELKDNSVFFMASWKTFKDLTETLETRKEMGLKSIKGYLVTIAGYAKDVLKDPTVANYNGAGTKGFHQGVRGLSAALATQTDPELKKFYGSWKPYAQDTFRPKADGEVKAKVGEVIRTLKDLQALV